MPYTIELDDELTVIAEYAAVPDPENAPPPRDSRSSNVARAMARWTTEAITENPIPGTDDIRQAYFDAKQALLAEHEAAGTECPGCEIGKLMRQFKDKLNAAGYFEKFE